MKIAEITQKGSYYNVKLKPNWLEKLLGFEAYTVTLKDSGSHFMAGGGAVYVTQYGEKLGNGSYIGEAIDKFRLIQSF